MAVLAMVALAVAPALANHDDDDDNANGVLNQNASQESESGNVEQSFNVSNTGDNSNQCAGVQGVANTGNAQNQVQTVQYASEGDFELDGVDSTVEVSPINTTECSQSIDQSAVANG